ncbi:MAG: hypothetical protein KKD28_10480 [Chloroflexi bacterium]|nr:hypothetical protein [Chloroflexota bacterium]
MAMRTTQKTAHQKEKGQAVTLFAIMLPLTTIFALLLFDYMITTSRLMDAVAVADLSAHAGAQEVAVYPDGVIYATDQGEVIAAAYFGVQAPTYVQLTGISCGRVNERPACQVSAQVSSPGFFLPQRSISFNAIGYLSNGVTRGDQ